MWDRMKLALMALGWPARAFLGAVVVVAVLWGAGALDRVVSGARDWWADRARIETREKLHALELENERLRGREQALAERAEALERAIEAKTAEIEQLNRKASEQDAEIQTGRERVGAVRRGRDPHPIDSDDLERRLRALYPDREP